MEPVTTATITLYLAGQAGKLIEGRAGTKINAAIDRVLKTPTIDKAFDNAFAKVAPENKTIKKIFLNKLLTAPEVIDVLKNTQTGALPQKQIYIDIFKEILPAGDPEETADKFILALYKGLSQDQNFVNLLTLRSGNKLDDIKTTVERIEGKIGELAPETPSNKTAWNIPKRNEFFTGRLEILEQLQNTLQTDHNVAINQVIHGLGGIGKSQITIEYAYRNEKDYDIAWWINAETKTTIEAALAELTDSLNLPEKQATDQNIKVRAALDHLNKTPNWLIIFDNVESSDDIWAHIPKAGHSIITTRNQNLHGFKQSIPIDIWADKEALQFVKTRLENANDEEITQLCELLGNLPLAMEQAVAYIAASELSILDYLEIFNKNQQKYLSTSSIPKEEYNATVATTWKLAIQKIWESKPAAIELLNMCAFMAPDDIPLDLITKQVEALPESLQALLSDKGEMAEMRLLFKRYSIASIKYETLSMHRLVQSVIRHGLAETQAKQSLGFVVEVMAKSFHGTHIQQDVHIWPAYKAWHLHILICGKYAQEQEVNLARVGYLYNNLAAYLSTIGLYDQVESLYIEASDIYAKVQGKEHPNYGTSLNNLALLYDDQGQYEKAEPLYIESRDIRAKVLGKEHPDYAASLNNLAELYRVQGQYDKAEPLYIESRDIRAKVLGKEHPDYATSLNNLALFYKVQDQYEKAEPLYIEANDIWRKVLGKEHPDYATSLNNLAELYRAQGRYDKAEPLFIESRDIKAKVLGKEHPSYATSLNSLALLYDDTGRYDKSEPLYREAIRIVKKVFGSEHPNTVLYKNNYKFMLDEMSQKK